DLLPVGAVLAQEFCINRDSVALLLEEARDGIAETRVGDPVHRVRFDREITARQLVLSLRSGLDARKPVRDGIVDRLIVAELEMKKRMVLGGAPVPAEETVAANEIQGSGDIRAGALRQDQQTAVGHVLAELR